MTSSFELLKIWEWNVYDTININAIISEYISSFKIRKIGQSDVMKAINELNSTSSVHVFGKTWVDVAEELTSNLEKISA